MGKKARIRCFVCHNVFKKREGEQTCPGCHSQTVAKLSKKRANDGSGDVEESELPKGVGVAQISMDDGNASYRQSPSKKRSKLETSVDQPTSHHADPEQKASPKSASKDARRLATDILKTLSTRVTVVESVGSTFADAVNDISLTDCIAVDCEGVTLSRTGALTLIQIATETNIYLFDVLKMGATTFDGDQSDHGKRGLKPILEDSNRRKLMFDCRVDSDALFHQFGVSLRGVLDLQLLAVAAERQQGKQIDFLPGFARCTRQWLGAKTVRLVSSLKEEIRALYTDERDGESALWGKRPMAIDLIRYAAVDVGLQLPLQWALINQHTRCADQDQDVMNRTLVASTDRIKEYRDLDEAHYHQQIWKERACVAPSF